MTGQVYRFDRRSILNSITYGQILMKFGKYVGLRWENYLFYSAETESAVPTPQCK